MAAEGAFKVFALSGHEEKHEIVKQTQRRDVVILTLLRDGVAASGNVDELKHVAELMVAAARPVISETDKMGAELALSQYQDQGTVNLGRIILALCDAPGSQYTIQGVLSCVRRAFQDGSMLQMAEHALALRRLALGDVRDFFAAARRADKEFADQINAFMNAIPEDTAGRDAVRALRDYTAKYGDDLAKRLCSDMIATKAFRVITVVSPHGSVEVHLDPLLFEI
jgi:hypothetical protein